MKKILITSPVHREGTNMLKGKFEVITAPDESKETLLPLPGIGGGVSCMLAYTAAKKSSKYPKKFGTGIIDGVVASETANNAMIGGAMIRAV